MGIVLHVHFAPCGALHPQGMVDQLDHVAVGVVNVGVVVAGVIPLGPGRFLSLPERLPSELGIGDLKLVQMGDHFFPVEYYLNKVLARLFFGEDVTDSKGLGEKELIAFVLNDLTFHRKIQVLDELLRAGKVVPGTFTAKSIKRLDNIRTKRNYFAHYPITLLPRQEADETVFEVRFESPKGTIEINQETMDDLTSDVTATLQEFHGLLESNSTTKDETE